MFLSDFKFKFKSKIKFIKKQNFLIDVIIIFINLDIYNLNHACFYLTKVSVFKRTVYIKKYMLVHINLEV